MEVTLGSTVRIALADASSVGVARREALALAGVVGLAARATGELGLVVTELANNVVHHAGGGELLLQPVVPAGAPAVDVLAIDRGPGMDLGRALVDGFSTRGTLGVGLGAVRRLAAEFDAYAPDGGGAVVFARVCARPGPPPTAARFSWGVVSRPLAGEVANGDAWHVIPHDDGMAVLVADGLGHGPLAAEASGRAVEVFTTYHGDGPERVMTAAQGALSGTRGAAVWAGDARSGILSHVSVGNVAARLVVDGSGRGLLSHNGTVGYAMRTSRMLHTPWPEGGVLVVHSDGLQGRWAVEAMAGAWRCHPAVIAGVLYRDHVRERDDATVLVVRRGAHPGGTDGAR